MRRRHRLFPKASLVQVPPKDLCHHSKSVLLPCPPHRIAPLWEREFLPRDESTTSLKEQPSSTHLPLYPYSRAVPETLPCLKHLTKNSKPLPYLKYQGIINASSYQHHINSSVFSLTNPEFRGKANSSLRTPSKFVKPSFSPKHKVETPLVFERFPKISTGWNYQKKEPTHHKQQPSPLLLCENRSEELPQLKQKPSHLQLPDQKDEELPQHKQKPPTLPISNYQDEAIPLISSKTMTMDDPSTCPGSQANARPVPAGFSRSAEAPQNLKHNIRVLTVMVGREGTNLWPKCLILQSPHTDHHHPLEKASDIDYLVNKVTRHAFEETALPFLKGNQQSGPCTSSLPKYVNRGTSTDFPWPPFNVMVANITSSDPNHQARVIMRQLRSFIPSTKSVSDPYLSLDTWSTSESFPFAEHKAEASPGPDYKVKGTTGLPLHSKHKAIIPPLGVDHFSKVSPDLNPQTTIPMGPEHRTSTSVVLSGGPAAASASKTQDKKRVSPPISQTECLLCPGFLDKDSLALESKFSGPIGLGQKAEAPIYSDNQVTSSLYPNQQTQVIQGPDCQNAVTLSPDDHVQFQNIFDPQKKETLVPIPQDTLELVGPHYQAQIVPDSYEMILLLSDKTKAIPPLSHDHTTEPETHSKATQSQDTKKQTVPQLCPDYQMVPPQTTEDHPREARPDTSVQVPHQTEVDFWKTMPQELGHQVITPPSQDDRETTSPGIDQKVVTPPRQDDSETPSLNVDNLAITPTRQDDSEAPLLNIDNLAITPTRQDDREAPSLNIDNLVITPLKQDGSETPSQDIDKLAAITPTKQDNSEAPSLNIDNLAITPTRQDDSEAPLLNIDNLAITPPRQDDNEAPSLNIDNLAITPTRQDDSEAPLLKIDNLAITPTRQDDREAHSLNIDNLVITPLKQDDSETPSQDIDHEIITTLWQNEAEMPSLVMDGQIITTPWKDDGEKFSPGIDCQVIIPPRQDEGKIPSKVIDNQIITASQQDDSETSTLDINCRVITPPWQNDSETPSLIIDGQVINPPWQDDTETPLLSITQPCQDDSETLSLGIDHQVINPPWQDNTEIPSLGKECQVITPPCQDDGAAPVLGIDHQVTTTPWQDNNETSSLGIDHLQINPQWQDEGKLPSLGIDHQVITPPWQDDSETPSLDIEHQVITPSKQDEGKTPFLGINHHVLTPPREDNNETSSLSIDHHIINTPWQDGSETPFLGIDHQFITPPRQDEGETPLLGTDHQIIIQKWQDDRETHSLGIDQQAIISPWQDDSETLSLVTDQQVITPPWEDESERPSLDLDHEVITPSWQDNTERPSLSLDQQVITLPWQDDNETPSLGLDCQVVTLPWQDDNETPSLGLDCQVVTLPWQDDNETPSLGLDHQAITTLWQDDGAVPSEVMDYQVITPPESYHLTEAIPSRYLNLEAVVEPSEQAIPLNYLDHGANMSMRPEYQRTASLCQSNQVEIGSDTNNQSTFPTDQDDQVIVSFMPEEKTIPLSPTSSNYKSKALFEFQNQTIQKREIPWHLKHIKPYTVEGCDNISERTVQAIVNSIPEEKIKNDICKQILFRRMKEITPRRPGKCVSTSYVVCLQCLSWVPNGCLHDKEMNHLFEAEMLVTPIPLPGSKEDMGLKFVLRVPHIPLSFFHQFFPEPQNQCLLHGHLSNFSSPSQIAPDESHVPATAKLLDYSDDDYTWKIKTSKNQQQFTKEMPMKRESNENEKSRELVKNFKSLLEKFQKQRQN